MAETDLSVLLEEKHLDVLHFSQGPPLFLSSFFDLFLSLIWQLF